VKTTETGELWDQSLRLPEITRKLKAEAGNATHFVVFDACRNTLKLTQPGSRTIVQSKGFVPVAQENGMLIAYATAEGELASDVGSDAGPYAKALAEEIVKPGIEAVIMFRAAAARPCSYSSRAVSRLQCLGGCVFRRKARHRRLDRRGRASVGGGQGHEKH
jgi:Caspase domain